MIKGGYGKKDPPLGLKRSKYTLDPVGLSSKSHYNTIANLKKYKKQNLGFFYFISYKKYCVNKIPKPQNQCLSFYWLYDVNISTVIYQTGFEP